MPRAATLCAVVEANRHGHSGGERKKTPVIYGRTATSSLRTCGAMAVAQMVYVYGASPAIRAGRSMRLC